MTSGGGSVFALLIWYAALLCVGAAAFPIAFALFPRLSDRGFGFSRVLGLAIPTYLLTLSVTLRLVPNGRKTALLCAAALAVAGAAAFFARRRAFLAFAREHSGRLLLSEAVFAFGFLFFLGFRALAPEIYWGEKPMEFAILNILVRTSTLPASDPWFAGAPLRYYTFGHQALAWLSLVTGLSTRFTFNLAFGFLGGATLQGAFALLTAWTGRLRAGFAGAGITALLGNLAGLRTWLVDFRPQHKPLDWNYFWATSRVIPATVNEYPLWSLVFADLHAHVMAIPFFLLVAASALELVRAHADPQSRFVERLSAAATLGLAAAAQVLTNAWDAPLLAGLLLLIPVVLAAAPGVTLRAVGRAGASGAVSLGVVFAAAWPLWVKGGGSPGIGRNWEPTPPGIEVLNVFGLFFFLALGWWLVACVSRLQEGGKLAGAKARLAVLLGAAAVLTAAGLASPVALCGVGVAAFLTASVSLAEEPEDRLAFGFAGTAFFLVAFALRFYIDSRFNTIFKLFLEAWLLFSVATVALVFGRPERRGAWTRWPLPLRIVAGGLFALAAFTAVSGARGYIISGRPMPPGAPTSPVTLDGLAYLERSHPGEYKAVLWLRDKVRGTPVILEAQGPGYGDFNRISMHTGLPTVVGWDPHVGQHGNPASEIASRRADVDAIYTIPSAEAAVALMRRYHVGYVYVGWLERKTYPADGLLKFGEATQLFQLAYENPEARVYRVVGGDTQDVITVRERVPVPRTEATERNEPDTPPVIRETAPGDRLPFSGMREPRDGTVDGRGRLWVADFGNSRLRIFDAAGGYLGGWGGRGNGTWGFNQLCSVSIRGDHVYVADTWNGRIESFTLAGKRKAEAGELYGPRGVAVTPDERVWVCDTGNHRIVVYDAALKQIATYGKKGSGHDELDAPVGMAVGSGGRIFVADSGNRRIQILDGSGAFQGSWPVPGWTSACEPHLEADDDGKLYVADPTGQAVLVYDTAGRVESRITRDGKDRPFAQPTGIAIATKTRILYVINSGDSSVAIVPLPRRTGK